MRKKRKTREKYKNNNIRWRKRKIREEGMM
jgi:hypothetical protein